MRCYRCNSVLSDTSFCNSCGTDVTLYKKIVRMSNTYYNMGLEKAKVRDLSGAADLLRRSVRIDKKNINARNLLGLVYYEMGECVAAFGEWVISKNIRSEKNVAGMYLKEVQSNPTKLNMMNQSVRKFNLALEAAGSGGDDMAIIQLKKILNMNPNFLKAQQLLALLYMKKGENEKAYKILCKAAKIDINNTLTLKYLAEIEKKKETQKKRQKDTNPPKTVAELKERDELSGNDVIIPKSTYREVNYGLITFINVVVGIIIGAALIFFVVTPAKQNDIDDHYKETINSYSDQVAMLNINVSELERNIEELENEKSLLQQQLDQASASKVDTGIYDLLLDAAQKYFGNDVVGCADLLYSVDTALLSNEKMTNVYNQLKALSFEIAGNTYNNLAYQSYNAGNYEVAIPYFERAIVFSPQNIDLMYNLGKCYKAQNGGENNDKSRECFQKVIELSPDSDYATWAKGQMR